MLYVWGALALLLVLAGLVGCVLPALPGPPLAWAGLFLLWVHRGFEPRGSAPAVPWILLGATAVVTVLDFLLPVLGARRYGATKAGVWGSILGMLAGAIWFPPFGLVLGTLVGAFAGEYARGAPLGASLRAGWGVFVGTMLGTVAKVALCGVIGWYVVAEVLAGP